LKGSREKMEKGVRKKEIQYIRPGGGGGYNDGGGNERKTELRTN